MNKEAEFPEFAGDRAGGINQRLREYADAVKAMKQAEASEKSELKAIKEHYDYYINKAKKKQETLKAELQQFIHADDGETSLSTTLGNIHLTKNNDSWNWPKDSQVKKLVNDLPKEFIKYTPALDKTAIKKATTITDDGKVVVTDTGQILKGISGEQGKGHSIAITLDKSLKGVDKK